MNGYLKNVYKKIQTGEEFSTSQNNGRTTTNLEKKRLIYSSYLRKSTNKNSGQDTTAKNLKNNNYLSSNQFKNDRSNARQN